MFNGRTGVGDYWKSVFLLLLINLVVGVGGAFLFGALGASILSQTSPTSIGGLFAGVIGVALLAFLPALVAGIFGFFVGLGLQIRRLHDINLSGWIVLLFWAVAAVVYIFGGTGTSQSGIPQYAPWAWAIIAIGSIAWIVISLWPGNPVPNTYGTPVSYRSWWAGLIGDKAPTGSLGKVFWTLFTLVALAAVGAGAYIVLHPAKTAQQNTLMPESMNSETETPNTNSVTQTTNAPNQLTPSPRPKPAPPQPKPTPAPSPSSSITGLGSIPAGTFTNNSFLESNTYTTPKGTQTLRPPSGWQGGAIMDSSFAAGESNGLTMVVFKNPSDPDWSIQTILIRSKRAGFSLSAAETEVAAKGTFVSRSDVSFYGMPGYTLEQTDVVQGVIIRTKVFVVASATKVYQLTGTAEESKWATYGSFSPASFATLQIH